MKKALALIHYRKIIPAKKYCCIFIFLFLLFFFSQKSFAQLTYANLIVQYDSPWVCKNLKLIPVRFKSESDGKANAINGGVISFEQALREGKISVKEMSLEGGADVGMLMVKNHSKKNVIVESGEMIAGGKQDRAFAETAIIPPGDDDNFLPVFCVEKGRWQQRMRSFRYAGPADAALRKQIDIERKQNKVWKEIDRQLAEKNVLNSTDAYVNLFHDSINVDSACIYALKKKLKESDSLFAGFVAITGDRIINCELFGSTDLFVTSFDEMLKSYMRSITPADGEPKVKDDIVINFLDKFLKTEEQQQKFLADHGRIFTYENKVIHLVAYPD